MKRETPANIEVSNAHAFGMSRLAGLSSDEEAEGFHTAGFRARRLGVPGIVTETEVQIARSRLAGQRGGRSFVDAHSKVHHPNCPKKCNTACGLTLFDARNVSLRPFRIPCCIHPP